MEPIKNPFYGAILLLKRVLDEETLHHIAANTAQTHFPDVEYEYYTSEELPDNTPVDIVDQYSAAIRDLPDGAVYLVVCPS